MAAGAGATPGGSAPRRALCGLPRGRARRAPHRTARERRGAAKEETADRRSVKSASSTSHPTGSSSETQSPASRSKPVRPALRHAQPRRSLPCPATRRTHAERSGDARTARAACDPRHGSGQSQPGQVGCPLRLAPEIRGLLADIRQLTRTSIHAHGTPQQPRRPAQDGDARKVPRQQDHRPRTCRTPGG